jgi:hypothetical protein
MNLSGELARLARTDHRSVVQHGGWKEPSESPPDRGRLLTGNTVSD